MQKVKYKNKIFLEKSVEVESRKGIILQSVYISQMSYFVEFCFQEDYFCSRLMRCFEKEEKR